MPPLSAVAQDTDGMKRIRLLAVPSTVKAKKSGRNLKSEFTGILSIDSEDGSVSDVKVKCTTDYSI